MARGVETAMKIRGHWQLFHRLWKVFTELATVAIKQGMPVHIEWPHGCSYLRDKRVIKFIRKFGGVTARFHGCAYGMVASSGEPIKKPWRVVSFNSSLPDRLNRKCPGDHVHKHIEGSETLKSSKLMLCVFVTDLSRMT